MAQRTKIFVPDDALVWVSADILNDSDPINLEVEVSDEEYLKNSRLPTVKKVSLKTLKLESFPLQNEIDESGVDDMTTLNFLHEASILDNLRRRFFSLKPYTYTGEICIAVNPYQWLNIYSEESRDQYLHTSRFELPPHVYATSSSAYKGLRDHNKNQSILVSGESGAGKTETVKILMSHVAQISGKPEDTTIEKVLKANPLLESFGNAKTGRNDNSSRFGKFTQLQFDQQSRLVGSRCVTYLLEKGDLNERNYHIFHEVFAAPESIKQSLCIGGKTCKDYFYTNQGDTVTHTIEHVPDSERFLSTLRTLELIGVSEKTRQQILQIIAGIVHMGQISFVGDADTSRIDPAVPESTIENCCSMLGLVPQAFKDRIVVRNVDAAGEALLVALSKEQAIDGRDALSKETYSRLFSWLVKVINESTAPSVVDSNRNRIIGLLDIFGFESFKVNRFEQLCINYTNEKLQQKFTSDVLQNVQAEYREEGLDWANIDYKDNNDVLDLLEGKLGFIALLNEECLMPKGSNSNFLNKIKNAFKENPLFSLSVQLSKDEFCIQHYAGKVSYNVNGFLERNKDALPPEMRLLMLTSTNELVAQIFTPLVVGGGDNPEEAASNANATKEKGMTRHQSQSFMKADTVFTKFRSQLISLMDSISSTNVNYVRCIKPNSNKSKSEYNRPMVVEQLRCSGIIEAVKVSRAAYPYRIPHKEFMSRFHCLRQVKWWITEEKKQAPADAGHESEAMKARNLMKLRCQILLASYTAQFNALPVKGGSSSSGKVRKPYEIGKSKVFFSDGVLELFERQRTQALGAQCVVIQRKFKTRRARKSFLFLRACAVLAQTFYRCRSAARKYGMILVYTRCIQSNFRRFSAMKLLVRMRRYYRATQIQSFYRMKKLRRRYLTARKGMILLGSIAKMMTQQRKYIQMRNKAREDALLVNQLEIVRQALAQEQQERLKLESELRAKANLALEEQQRQQEALDKANREKEQKLAEENEALKRMIEELRLSKEAALAAAPPQPAAATEAPAPVVVETKTVVVEVVAPPPAPVVVTVAPSDYDAMKQELAMMEKMKQEMNEMARQLQAQKEEHERQLQQQVELLKAQAEQQAAALAAAALAAAAASSSVSPKARRPSSERRPSGAERRPSGSERRPSGADNGVPPPPAAHVHISPRMNFSKHQSNGHTSGTSSGSHSHSHHNGHHSGSHPSHVSHGGATNISSSRAGRSAVLRRNSPAGRAHSITSGGLHPHKHVHNGAKALRDIKMVEKLKSTESELAQYKKKIEQLEAMNRKLKTKGHQPPSQSTDADMSSDSDDSREDGRGATEEELQVELENRKSDFNSYLESFQDLTVLMVDEEGNPLYKPYEAEFDENGNEILPPGVLPPDFDYLTQISDDDEDLDGDDESESGRMDGDAAAAALEEEEAMQRRIHNSGMRDSDDEMSRGGLSVPPSDDELDRDSDAENEEAERRSDAGRDSGVDRESFDPYSAYPDEHGDASAYSATKGPAASAALANGKGRSSDSFDIADVYAKSPQAGKPPAGNTPASSNSTPHHRSMSVAAAVMSNETKTQTPVRSASMLIVRGSGGASSNVNSSSKSFTTPSGAGTSGAGGANLISPVPMVSTPFASDPNNVSIDPTQMTPLQMRKASFLATPQDEENLQGARETLHAAIDAQDLDTIHDVLISYPKAARSITEGGMTALHVASKSNSIELVQTLLQYNFHIDAVDDKGKTALHHCRDPKVIALLCTEGADVNKTDSAGWTPLLEYVHGECVACVQAIMPFNANVAQGDPVSLRTPLHVAADLGNAELLMALISTLPPGFNFDQPDADGYTALHLAAASDRDSQGTLAIMMSLLNRGASAVMCNERGVTPLHLICANRSLSQLNLAEPIVELLLSIQADPNAQDVDGCTPLIVACAYREWGLCKLLLEAGGDLNVPCNMSSTFLQGDGRLSASKEKNDLKTVQMMEKADCTASDLMTKTSRYKLFHYICVPQARIPGETRDRCMNCANVFSDGSFFSISSGRHHCRHCLRVICSDCSPKQLPRAQMPSFVTNNNAEANMRVCLVCHDVLKDRADAAAAQSAKNAGATVKKGTFW